MSSYPNRKILHGLRKLSGVVRGRVAEHLGRRPELENKLVSDDVRLDLNLFKKLLEVYTWMEFNSPKARCACEVGLRTLGTLVLRLSAAVSRRRLHGCCMVGLYVSS